MALIAPFFAVAVALPFIFQRYVPDLLLLDSFVLTSILLFLAQVSQLLLWCCVLRPKLFSPLRQIPGPKVGDSDNERAHKLTCLQDSSFFLGQFRRLIKDPTGEPLRQWVEEIPNNGIIRYLDIFNIERLAVVSPAALADVLVHKCYDFEKPSQIRKGISRILGMGLFLAEGNVHKRQRKDLMPAFSFRHIKDLYPAFWSKSQEMVRAILVESENAVNVNAWASRAALDIIGVAGLGRDFGAIKDPESDLNRTYRKIFKPSRTGILLGLLALVFPSWLIRLLPFERNQDIEASTRVIHQVCYDLINSKRRALKGKEAEVDILAAAMESGGFTDEELVNQLMTFLVAGHETTASALTWAIYMICKNPVVQERLRKEVIDRLPDPMDPDSTITNVDIDSMPYLNAVCNEVLRLYPPVALTVREAARDTSILGQAVPKGTSIIIPPWAVNASTALWGNNGRSFDPERWLGAGKANTGGTESNYAFLTFLHGPRSCIGQGFAKAEFACLLAVWVGTFETELAEKDYVPKVGGGITAKPRDGVPVRVSRLRR